MATPKVNTKKQVATVLGNAFVRVQSYLLDKDPDQKKIFDQAYNRMKRLIAAERGDESPLNRKYPVELAAKFNTVSRLLNPPEINIKNMNDFSREDLQISSIGAKFADVLPTLLKGELEVFRQLDEKDMSAGRYLGVDTTAEAE